MKSGLFNLNWKDIGKGLIMAFLGAFLTAIYSAFQPGDPSIPVHFPTAAEWLNAAKLGAGAMILYLLKNFLTGQGDEFLKK